LKVLQLEGRPFSAFQCLRKASLFSLASSASGEPAAFDLPAGHAGCADGCFTKLIISELVAVMDNKDESVFCGKGVKDSRGQVKYKGETPKSFLQRIHLNGFTVNGFTASGDV